MAQTLISLTLNRITGKFKKKFKFSLKRTALHFACRYGQFEYVKLMVEGGKTELNPVDAKGKTPLKYVQEKMKKSTIYGEIFNYLQSKGASIDWKNT